MGGRQSPHSVDTPYRRLVGVSQVVDAVLPKGNEVCGGQYATSVYDIGNNVHGSPGMDTEQPRAYQTTEQLSTRFWRHEQDLLVEDPAVDVVRLRFIRQRASVVGHAEGQERRPKCERKENAKERKGNGCSHKEMHGHSNGHSLLGATVIRTSTKPAPMEISEAMMAHWKASATHRPEAVAAGMH